jgi:hypothetical protein
MERRRAKLWRKWGRLCDEEKLLNEAMNIVQDPQVDTEQMLARKLLVTELKKDLERELMELDLNIDSLLEDCEIIDLAAELSSLGCESVDLEEFRKQRDAEFSML